MNIFFKNKNLDLSNELIEEIENYNNNVSVGNKALCEANTCRLYNYFKRRGFKVINTNSNFILVEIKDKFDLLIDKLNLVIFKSDDWYKIYFKNSYDVEKFIDIFDKIGKSND